MITKVGMSETFDKNEEFLLRLCNTCFEIMHAMKILFLQQYNANNNPNRKSNSTFLCINLSVVFIIVQIILFFR